MKKTEEFSFGSDSVAQAYDNGLVPVLFDPWAQLLIKEFGPWEGRHVLDLATGTGIVASQLLMHIGSQGKVTAVDINAQMLALAKKRCENGTANIEFKEGSAESIDVPDGTVDVLVCQQGFQFFPDKVAAAKEIQRILKPQGKAVLSTWCPVSECELFGAVCEALEQMGEYDISEMMRLPFDHLTAEELQSPFHQVGFSSVELIRQEQNLFINGGIKEAIDIAYATPIGPKLVAMSDERQQEFRQFYSEIVHRLSPDTKDMGRMASNVVVAHK